MTRIGPLPFRRECDDQADADRQTASLAALAVVLLLVVLGLFLVRTLSAADAVQDCLLAGRHDCDAMLTLHVPPPLW